MCVCTVEPAEAADKRKLEQCAGVHLRIEREQNGSEVSARWNGAKLPLSEALNKVTNYRCDVSPVTTEPMATKATHDNGTTADM